MGLAKKLLVGAGAVTVLAVASGAGFYGWAASERDAALARTWETHDADFPVPWPLTAEEIALLPEGADPAEVARERAIERGTHLIEARYFCNDCHKADLGGGSMVDDPAVGRIVAPNLTVGRIAEFEPADFDRIVRHGVKQDRTVGLMPSGDFVRMTDQELSDIVTVLRNAPDVDRDPGATEFGPVLTMLIGTGQIAIAPVGEDVHEALPPAATPDASFGEHLAQTCVGCHRKDYSGGPIVGAPPDWAPAANLTPRPDGLGAWSYEDFERAVRQGKRPDGTELRAPMPWQALSKMSDTEVRALYDYLQSVPVAETGE
jgi:cytochrome c553